MSTVVVFCRDCFRPFDAKRNGNRIAEVCDECKKAINAANARRWKQEKRRALVG